MRLGVDDDVPAWLLVVVVASGLWFVRRPPWSLMLLGVALLIVTAALLARYQALALLRNPRTAGRLPIPSWPAAVLARSC